MFRMIIPRFPRSPGITQSDLEDWRRQRTEAKKMLRAAESAHAELKDCTFQPDLSRTVHVAGGWRHGCRNLDKGVIKITANSRP